MAEICIVLVQSDNQHRSEPIRQPRQVSANPSDVNNGLELGVLPVEVLDIIRRRQYRVVSLRLHDADEAQRLSVRGDELMPLVGIDEDEVAFMDRRDLVSDHRGPAAPVNNDLMSVLMMLECAPAARADFKITNLIILAGVGIK